MRNLTCLGVGLWVLFHSLTPVLALSSLTAEDYAIYWNDVVALGYTRQCKKLSVDNRTFDPQQFNGPLSRVLPDSPYLKPANPLFASFLAISDQPMLLEEQFPTTTTAIQTIDHDRINNMVTKRDFWALFYKDNPDSCGLLEFSPVAYDSERLQAIHYITFSKGAKWGDAFFMVYTNKRKRWHLSKSIRVFKLRRSTVPEKFDLSKIDIPK